MKKVKAIILFILLVVSAISVAQVHDFCSFAGKWVSQENDKLTIHFSDNQSQCVFSGRSTDDIAIANNKIYINFKVGQKIDGCVTIDTIGICIGSIEEDVNTLRLTLRYFVKIHSQWRNEFKPVGVENIIIFHKMKDFSHDKVIPKKVVPKGIGIQDTTCKAFKWLQRGIDYSQQKLFWFANNSYEYAIDLANEKSLSESDRHIITGQAYYKRLKLIADGKIQDWKLIADVKIRAPIDTMRVAKEVLNHLPQNDVFFTERTYANMYLIEDGFNTFDSVDNWFSYFAFLSDVINKYESRNSRNSLRNIDSINLQNALTFRSNWFITCIRDTLSGIDDLERALEVSQNSQWDSACRIRLSNLYCELALSSEPDTIKDSPTGKALDYYKKSKEHFEKAQVRDITALGISDIQPLYAYYRLDKDTVKLNVHDSIITDFCYKNPNWISPLHANFASLTTAVLLNRSSYDSLYTFYDSIRNRFVFDHDILDNYLVGLICDGYSFDDVRKVGKRLSAMGEDGKAHSARVKWFMGDFDGMFEDLLNNEKVFDSINDMAGEAFSYGIIASMAGEKLGYKEAQQYCYRWASAGIDTSTMLCYSGIYKLKYAEEKTDKKIQRKLKNLAEEDLRTVIAYENSHKETLNTPYAYYWLGRKDSAIYWTEKMLQGKDLLAAYSVAADIYCLLEDYPLAKSYIDCYVEYADSIGRKEFKPYLIGLLKYNDNLKPIRGYVDSLCAQLDSVEALSHSKRILFDTTTTTMTCRFNKGGSVYLPCKFGQVADTMLLFDPGAQYLQITKKFACELMEKDTNAIYYIGIETLTSFNNDNIEQEMVIIDSIKLGDKTLRNVVATIAEDPQAPMLLGMSVLGAFDIELSIRESKITFKYIKEILKKD